VHRVVIKIRLHCTSRASNFSSAFLFASSCACGGGDANTDYLSDGIAESLTDSLTHVPQLKVKSLRSALQFKG